MAQLTELQQQAYEKYLTWDQASLALELVVIMPESELPFVNARIENE